ncbi:hypothetical protein CB0940_08906 [Cercospora beticola]|uniref:FAD-binding PCMH-type domain-containing protein n=1 Tax=Cercospora beticola TaxID=122368 RepID=A0A2G5HNN5_CERBT|nr:hypothetical protein CB0940_08906 [Cercospora beticola]PIA94128.1 hypothetical protein CB0940_08906 [Cercospora beticola]WPB05500.1 hypothetical protein RHO25_010152 [Cercospora beticola]
MAVYAEKPAAQEAIEAVVALQPFPVILPGTEEFLKVQESYWNAQQRSAAPSAFFQPHTPEHVSGIVQEIVRARLAFAIKGGGHSSNLGGSSTNDGVTIDLSRLDHIVIAKDKKTVRLGPGVRWGVLFRILDEQKLAAAGGRDASVGVPGFLFGGGLSAWGAKHGWGSDSIISADVVVLADGTLVTADQQIHPDLLRALKGGGAHNFGIVTSVTIKLHPCDGMWGGMQIVSDKSFPDLFEAIDCYAKSLAQDGMANLIVDVVHHNDPARFKDTELIALVQMAYCEPTPEPAVFQALRELPSTHNSGRLASSFDFETEMAEMTYVTAKRNIYWTICMQYNKDLLKAAFEIWQKSTAGPPASAAPAFDIQFLAPALRNKSAREGLGELFGIQGPDEPLVNLNVAATWTDEKDDKAVTSLTRNIVADIEELARTRGFYSPFNYMNYAHREQDVIGSYGPEKQAFLRRLSAKYDPQGVFQK